MEIGAGREGFPEVVVLGLAQKGEQESPRVGRHHGSGARKLVTPLQSPVSSGALRFDLSLLEHELRGWLLPPSPQWPSHWAHLRLSQAGLRDPQKPPLQSGRASCIGSG